jgi:hypothetical protein
VHALGVAGHGGHLLDHLEVGVKHNETSPFTELLGSVALAGAADQRSHRRERAGAVGPGVVGQAASTNLHMLDRWAPRSAGTGEG